MTVPANWNTRFEVQKQHIRFREEFYEVKFNVLHRAWAHFFMMFVKKDTIIRANCELARVVQDYGTAKNLREQLK